MVMTDLHWQSSAVTHCGSVRKVNEDSILDSGDVGLWVVADGMGGHEAGDLASGMLVDSLGKVGPAEKLSAMVDRVEDIVQDVHRRIREHSANVFGGRTMGCTIISLVIRGNVGACLWAGDSRLYRFRGGLLSAVSQDHSHVSEMVQQGLISAEEADNHPSSNIITRAVGATPQLYLDTTIFTVEPGDLFLLCSDGLYGELSLKEMEKTLKSSSLEESADILLQGALDRGARDNVSIIVVQTAEPKG